MHCAHQQLSWWSARAPQPAHPHQSQSAQPARPAQNQQRMPHSCKIKYASNSSKILQDKANLKKMPNEIHLKSVILL